MSHWADDKDQPPMRTGRATSHPASDSPARAARRDDAAEGHTASGASGASGVVGSGPEPAGHAPSDAAATTPPGQSASLAGRLLRWAERSRGRLILIGLAVYLLGYNGAWRIGPDSALYLTVARNVARGTGFTHPSRLQGRLSPGLPWLEAGLMRLAGPQAHWLISGFMLAAALLGLVLTYRLVRLRADPSTALVVAAMLAVNETWYRYGYQFLTDMPFALGGVVFLLGYERSSRRSPSLPARPGVASAPDARASPWLDWTLMAAGLVVMALFRSVVLTFAAAVLATAAYRALRHGRWRGLAAMAVVLLAGLAAVRLIDPRLSHADALVGDEARVALLLTHRLPHLLGETLTHRLPRMFTEVASEAVLGADLGPALSVAAGLFIVATGLWLFRQRVLWGMVFIAFFAQWLLFDVTDRYFLVIMPLLAFAWWRGCLKVGDLLPVRWRDATVLTLLLLWMIPNAVQTSRFIAQQRLGGRSPRNTALVHLARRARTGLAANAVVLCASGDLALPLTYLADRRFELTRWGRKHEYRRLAGDGRLYVLTPMNASTKALIGRLKLTPRGRVIQAAVRCEQRILAVDPLVRRSRGR